MKGSFTETEALLLIFFFLLSVSGHKETDFFFGSFSCIDDSGDSAAGQYHDFIAERKQYIEILAYVENSDAALLLPVHKSDKTS